MPGRIDTSLPFRPLNIAILTVSDTRGAADDRSGDTLVALLEKAGHRLVERDIVRDEQALIAERFKAWAKREDIEVILSTGGTGVTGRDVTPEALDAVADKKIPGFGELFRWLSFEKIGTSTIQSRADAGLVDGTYVFILPGSPGACRDAWEGILESQLDIRHRPCNFAEMMPRLRES
ncbi:MAG: molybdenum cofactor biosynthesis protein B [Geminicoccaceae bacterium]